jgi:hypothetical protein
VTRYTGNCLAEWLISGDLFPGAQRFDAVAVRQSFLLAVIFPDWQPGICTSFPGRRGFGQHATRHAEREKQC